MKHALLLLLFAVGVGAQIPTILNTPVAPSQQEQADLMKAVTDGATSAMDLVRAFESFLLKYPSSTQRAEVEYAVAKAAAELKDDARTIRYGERVLAIVPDDILMLERVSGALVRTNSAANAEKILRYARHLEDLVDKMKVEPGRNAGQMQEDRDRALARMMLYQARARALLGQNDEAVRLAARAFAAYPDVEGAKEWAEQSLAAGKGAEAIAHYAEAFIVPDKRATDEDRLKIRLKMGEVYRALHESEKGLGDEILAAYDRTSAAVELRNKKLAALDPNTFATLPLEYTVSKLDGTRMSLATLKNKVIVLDFWATWCGPCRVQHPMYEELKQHYKGRTDVEFLALDTDEDRDLVVPFLNEQKWDKANIYFDDGMSRLMQVSQIPTTILFNKSGRLSSRMNGFTTENFVQYMIERIDAALKEQ